MLDGLGPPGDCHAPFAFPIISMVNRFCTAILYGRAGRSLVQNGGVRRGQGAATRQDAVRRAAATARAALWPRAAVTATMARTTRARWAAASTTTTASTRTRWSARTIRVRSHGRLKSSAVRPAAWLHAPRLLGRDARPPGRSSAARSATPPTRASSARCGLGPAPARQEWGHRLHLRAGPPRVNLCSSGGGTRARLGAYTGRRRGRTEPARGRACTTGGGATPAPRCR